MAITQPAIPEVLPVSQAREELSKVIRRFREEGLSSKPIIFGSHRKPEAVTIPYELFEALLPAIEDVLLAETIREGRSNRQSRGKRRSTKLASPKNRSMRLTSVDM